MTKHSYAGENYAMKLDLHHPNWVNELQSHLNKLGHRVLVAHTLTDTMSFGAIDAIITLANPINLVFFQRLSTQAQHPLLVLIDSEKEPHASALGCADFVIPNNPSYIVPQIMSALKILSKSQAHAKNKIDTLETEIKAQKRINTEIETLKNAIVRNVSHELRTPLLQVKTGIALMGDAITANTMPSMTVFTLAQDATAALEWAVKHITMLGTSLDCNPNPIILRDVVEYSKRNLSRVWQRKGDTERIIINIEPHLPPVEADKQGLSTALQLLLDNALKFSKNSPDNRVIVSGKKDGDSVIITIQDFGIGIPKDILNKVFTLFFQADSSNTRIYGGMGIGLGIVKLIMDSHNTEIVVVTEEGKGSSFSFRLNAVDLSSPF